MRLACGTVDGVNVQTLIKQSLPGRAIAGARRIRRAWKAHALRGDVVECPLCGGTFRAFLPVNGRDGASCPRCGSVERHRAAWIYLRDHTNLLTDRLRVLHVAPEPGLEERLRAAPHLDYVTGDLLDPAADVRLDLTAIDAPDGAFDVVLCSHVLEHIEDDVQAMREIRRVLSPAGWAYLVVPVARDRDVIYEDATITTRQGRLAAFGQEDHVRWYTGPGFEDRLVRAGLGVARVEMADAAPADRHRLIAVGGLAHDWAVVARRAASLLS